MNHIDLVLNSEDIVTACFTEHWMTRDELNIMNFDNFRLCSIFSRTCHKNDGVVIFCRNKLLSFIKNLTLEKYCRERKFEISGISLKFKDISNKIACIYRSSLSEIQNVT